MAMGLEAKPDCIPCALRQALSAARRVSSDEWLHAKVLKRVMSEMVHADLARSPAEVTFEALQIASRLLGGADAFAEDKRRHNELVKALLPGLRRRVAESSDSLSLALISRYSSLMPHRKAAKVLPDPVGDRIRVCSPRWMAGQPSA